MRAVLLAFSPFSRLACRLGDALYRRGVLRAERAPIPAASVGNLAFGGSGKTPIAIELIGRLFDMGHRPAFVSRGYRGAWETSGGTLSDGERLLGTWAEGGDEPFMVAKRFPRAGVFVGKDRLASCRMANELGFTAVVLDDAFQHRRLARDLDIVLVSPAERRPLREGPAALARADVILVRRDVDSTAGTGVKSAFRGTAVYGYSISPVGVVDVPSGRESPASSLGDRRVFAFCGIAGPQRFLSSLAGLGADVAGGLTFPDHHAYPAASLKRIADAFSASGAETLLTTEKDAVKLALAGTRLAGLPVAFLRVRADIEPGFFERFEASFPRPGGVAAGAAGGGPAE